VTAGLPPGDTGPGIIETTLVLGLAVLLAVVIVAVFGSPLAHMMGSLVDLAHGNH
jgi:hypothetical protein